MTRFIKEWGAQREESVLKKDFIKFIFLLEELDLLDFLG
jgi:hypothetical protein